MGSKNIYMDSDTKSSVSFGDNFGMDKAQRLRSNNWIYIHNSIRIYRKQMGEITGKAILNIAGIAGVLFGFLSNLNNILSVFIGIGSLMYLVFRGLKERENWLHRKSERKRQEFEQMIREEEYIRKQKFDI